MRLTPKVNLHILAARFTQLSRSAYFDPAFKEFSSRTLEAIEHVIERWDDYPDKVVQNFVQHAWAVIRFLHGSRSNDAPHETQFVLQKALKDWVGDEALISSAALEEFTFFLQPLDLWGHISQTLNHFDTNNYSPLLVRIGSPIAYKNRPIFCAPLFHELGHFVDHHYQVTAFSLLLAPPNPCPAGLDAQIWRDLNLRHRMEHFADLFAASYCGTAAIKTLTTIAPDAPDSNTHPSTEKRVKVMESYLENKTNALVTLVKSSLNSRGLPNLAQRFKIPEVSKSFDQLLTKELDTVEELYGIYSAGWDYLIKQVDDPTAAWVGNDGNPYIIEKTINDLIEKSIRNYEIRERWSNGFAN